MGETKIEWTASASGAPGFTFNPWRGCSTVSPGCKNCYAVKRLYGIGVEAEFRKGVAADVAEAICIGHYAVSLLAQKRLKST